MTRAQIKKSVVSLPRALMLGLLALGLTAAPLGADAARKKPAAQKQQKEQAEGVVNINTASGEQLELLPGIGPSKSRAIVHYRERRKFKATHELIRVKGIGRKTLRRLRPYLTVKGPTTLAARPARRSPDK